MRFASVFISLAIAAVAIAAPSPEAPETPEAFARKGLASGKCRSVEYRKEWRALKKVEQDAYLKAVLCLSKRPHSDKLKAVYPRPSQAPVSANSSFYDDMVYIHMDLTNVIHNTALFLPWHRWYVDQHVKELRSQCGYKGVLPYWDPSRDVPNVNNGPVFDNDAFGGWGDPNDDQTIQYGILKEMQLAYPAPHRLRRQWTPRPWANLGLPVPDPNEEAYKPLVPEKVQAAINGCVGDFKCFHNLTEPPVTFHSNVHLMTGGDLGGTCPKNDPLKCAGGGPTFSSNDPLFYLHHANIDRIWFLWQLRHKQNFDLFEGGSKPIPGNFWDPNGMEPMLDKSAKLPASGLFPERSVSDVMNPMGGYLCFVYI